jgi:methionyl-tRNA formyltransferase
MKIAYFGYNAFSSCLAIFERHNHEIACIFTGESSPHTDQITAFAERTSCQIFVDKPSQAQMEALVRDGVECFFAAEYPWRIPIPTSLPFAINVHPTLLPYGKGPTPLPSLILKESQYSGVTLHKMTSEFDDGDILLQEAIALADNESFDSLSAKLAVTTPLLLNKLLSNLHSYYQDSTPQRIGSYWPKLSREDQTVHWNSPTATLSKQFRAFASLGVYSEIDGQPCLITAAEWELHSHTLQPGTILSADNIALVITTSDGFVRIPRKHLFSIKP